METTKKPTVIPAALVTITLVCCLITLLLMVTGYPKQAMLFQVLTMALLLLSAIISWRAYTKKYVDYEVQHRLTQQSTE
jgi:uncharacterized membrane protein